MTLAMTGPTVVSGTREQILDAVLSCLAEGGIAGVSMRAVAAEAGVSLGLLNYHFAGKQALIAEAVQVACDRLLSDSLASINGVVGADDRVRAFIRGAAADEFLLPEYLRFRLVIWAVARLYPDLGVVDLFIYQEYVDRMKELIREARPGLSVEDAYQRADDVSINQNGLWLHWARFRDRETLERGLRRCEDIALGAG
jgi:TetR/AcrR family transcriptional regulator, cholesterol catabolism regulator